MAITRSATAKAKRGNADRLQRLLKAHDRREELHIPPVKPLPLPLPSKKQSRRLRRRRLERMHDSILGPWPVFPGAVVIPSAVDARLPDSTRIQDLELLLQTGAAQVYWVDGSESKGFLGAGVVWKEGCRFISVEYPLGQSTGGNNSDSELFALAAALGRAKKFMQKGNQLKVVRVFSDAQGILQKIHNGVCYIFGPMLTARTALEGLYDRAQWLKDRNVSIELTWIKGHSGSEGNILADKAACQATVDQALSPPPPTPFFSVVKTELDVPQMWRDRGQDWIDEWLWRANHTHTLAASKQMKRLGKQLVQRALVPQNEVRQIPLPKIGPSADDYAAVELHNNLDATKQAAIEAYHTTPDPATVDDRLIRLCEIRQKLQKMLAAVAERSR
jgi:ribonuclease HI